MRTTQTSFLHAQCLIKIGRMCQVDVSRREERTWLERCERPSCWMAWAWKKEAKSARTVAAVWRTVHFMQGGECLVPMSLLDGLGMEETS